MGHLNNLKYSNFCLPNCLLSLQKMMTFVLNSNFIITASLLDNQRLGKQRVEAYQIINTILSPTGNGWSKHPIVPMWRNHLDALKYYFNCIVREWVKRGFENNMALYDLSNKLIILPWWVYWDKLIYSHQAMLIRKDPNHYKNLFNIPNEYINYGYIWAGSLSIADKDRELGDISAPIPEHLVASKYCPALTKAGNPCSNILKKGKERCGVHS